MLNIFPLFTSREKIIEILEEKYEQEKNRTDILRILSEWVNDNNQSWHSPKDYQKFVNFAEKIHKTDPKNEKMASLLLDRIRTSLNKGGEKPKTFPEVTKEEVFSVFKEKPKLIAQIITYHDKLAFRKVKLFEFVGQKWSKFNGRFAPHLLDLIDRFNRLCYFFATAIVLAPNKKRRESIVSWLVELMQCFYNLNNFSGFQAVNSAFSSVVIFIYFISIVFILFNLFLFYFILFIFIFIFILFDLFYFIFVLLFLFLKVFKKLQEKGELKLSKKDSETITELSEWIRIKNYTNYR